MSTRALAQINLSALQHNFQQVKRFAANSRILAMVKANAYGHGSVQVAQALSAADAFGVAILEEALMLRQHGIQQPIVVMGGFADADELAKMLHDGISPVIYSAEQVSLLEQATLTQPTTVWFKIDTGMHRLGFLPAEAAGMYQRLRACPLLQIIAMTHFACSDEPDNPATEEQLAEFNGVVSAWPVEKSLACSASIIGWPKTQADWVRPGIMLYGVSPFAGSVGSEFNLQPVMTLSSKLLAIKNVRRGESVGYGATWVCPDDMPLGVVAIGYGDGYPRHAKNGTPVLVDGKLCTLAGRVSMDLITVDLTNHPHAAVGDRVVLWGEGLPVEQVAHHSGTIGYELLCKVTRRVEFQYSDVNSL